MVESHLATLITQATPAAQTKVRQTITILTIQWSEALKEHLEPLVPQTCQISAISWAWIHRHQSKTITTIIKVIESTIVVLTNSQFLVLTQQSMVWLELDLKETASKDQQVGKAIMLGPQWLKQAMEKISLTQCIERRIQTNYHISLQATAKKITAEPIPQDSLSNKAVSEDWQLIAIKENEKKNIPT